MYAFVFKCFSNSIAVREASHIDFVHEKRRTDVTPPPLETSRTFFDPAEAHEALFFLQA